MNFTKLVLIALLFSSILPLDARAALSSAPVANPCADPLALTSFSFSAQAASLVAVPGTAGLRTVVCSLHIELLAATLAATTLVTGTGSVCGTGTATIDSFGASAGRFVPFSTSFGIYAALPTAADLCFNVGASVAGLFDISGTYVQI
jgi:hypothetical protein